MKLLFTTAIFSDVIATGSSLEGCAYSCISKYTRPGDQLRCLVEECNSNDEMSSTRLRGTVKEGSRDRFVCYADCLAGASTIEQIRACPTLTTTNSQVLIFKVLRKTRILKRKL